MLAGQAQTIAIYILFPKFHAFLGDVKPVCLYTC